MTIPEALNYAQKALESKENPQPEAFALLGHILDKSRPELILNREQTLTQEQQDKLELWLKRRVTGEPLAHITGKADFFTLTLTVSPEVLIPRPETEVLVDLALKDLAAYRSPKVLDLASGSGAIALAIKQARPDAFVMATDISEAALKLAKLNAQALALEVHFLQADLLQQPELATYASQLDMLLANLPYLPENDRSWVSKEVQHDPDIALYAGKDGLKLFRQLEVQAFGLLKAGCVCFFELDPRNIAQAYALCSAWPERNIFQDLTSRNRFLRLVR